LTAARVLIADDDPLIRQMLRETVSALGHDTETASTAAEAVATAEGGGFDLVLLDLRFPDCTDLSTLKQIREKAPGTDVIMVTAETDDLTLVTDATRLGAFDYVPKPVREDDIRIRVTRLMEMRSLSRTNVRMAAEIARGREFQDIVGESPALRNIVRQAQKLAAYDIPVLITGETGTGKELIARALHYGGPRREAPFLSINCAALPTELVESELFGHERGAFTGAHVARKGAFQEAEDGTLFLDEIGDMSLQSQAALLHVLERGEYRSVGGRPKTAQAHVVLASNQDLDALIRSNAFRKDLFYRINRIHIEVPPLRRRQEDIPLLAQHFLRQVEEKIGKGVHSFAPRALKALGRYDWPGNVRELKNEIERAYLYAEGEIIQVLDLSPQTVASRPAVEGEPEAGPAAIEEIQRLVEALRSSAWNVSKTAEILGVHRNTVHRWMKKYSLDRA